jgi:formylglycine-generating enzyme required for sulfatase activity
MYELGATLYNLLTCRQPPLPSEILEDGVSAFTYPESVSSETKNLITWMMTPDRRKRPQSVEDIEQRLKSRTIKYHEEETSFVGTKANDKTDGEETTFLDTVAGSAAKQQQPTVGRTFASYKPLLAAGVLAIICFFAWMIWPTSEKENAQSQETAQPIDSQESVVLQNLVNNMVYVEGGTFTMGATSEQGSDAADDEKPAHQVTLSSFSIGKYEVTQEEWEAVMGSNPSDFKGAKRPVEQVSWEYCQEFIRKLNQLTGKKFRLPTEAEWEYAARGGNRSVGYKYAGSDNLGSVAWYEDNSGSETHPVGQKSPNELGLYDMSGNVWEWCQDWYGSYSSSSQTNPTGPNSGSDRVGRGGSWDINAGDCRSSFRNFDSPSCRYNYLGLRLAL